ncbi:Exonuclease [Aphelenchoides bicaudatus]|nr:Exonuclease [Aphelenchoides bicaudatus]
MILKPRLGIRNLRAFTTLKQSTKPRVYCAKSLSLDEIARLCHSIISRDKIKCPACVVCKDFKPSQLVLLRVNCTEEQIPYKKQKFNFDYEFFDHRQANVDPVVNNSKTYWDRLLTVSKDEQVLDYPLILIKLFKRLRINNILKLQLLTDVETMYQYSYPNVGSIESEVEGLAPVVSTKKRYKKVTKDSPIFVVDCEMCRTTKTRGELTRVTLLNERGKTLIDTYVKPFNKILDYSTCFSGITEKALETVSIRVEDVQKAFQRLLPSDAILCGHSIEADLKAMRLAHPYCIDIGFAYNTGKLFQNRPSLRELSYFYCNQKIQHSSHCSYEDAKFTLQLLNLKLQNGIRFGNANHGFDYAKWAKQQGFDECIPNFNNKAVTKKMFYKRYDPYFQLPDPRHIGECSTCRTPFYSQCYIDGCSCSSNVPNKCCVCIAKNGKEETFVDNKTNHQQSMSLQDFLGSQEDEKIMIARYLDGDEVLSNSTNKNIHIYDMTPFESVAQVEENVLNKENMKNDLCLLEYNAQKSTTDEINQLLRTIYNGLVTNGVFGYLFCSPTRAVLNFSVKKPVCE